MIRPYTIPLWKKAPFIRLLLPLIAGIVLQWYVQFSLVVIITAFITCTAAYAVFLLLPLVLRFKAQALQGVIIQLSIAACGAWITWQQDVRHHSNWYGNYYTDSSYLLVRVDEPLVEKNKSYKADGFVEAVVQDGKTVAATGKLLLYFSKDSVPPVLQYGDRILLHARLQPIKNSGNPGAFNYQRYAAFQGIFHTVFLKQNDWRQLQGNSGSAWKRFIFAAQTCVLDILRSSMDGGKDELGIAEALLIGYTNDLDKDLVQAYSNTGVVHIIAISGMHLALIYLLLVWLFAKIPVIKRSKGFQLLLVLACLWMFSLLTGASPSVLRAAVMFSFIAIGKNFFKQASVFNALAASAFVLLCYDPYFLWAVGFQLSYLAVLSIVIFQKPIYHCCCIKNKQLDKVWQLAAVSVAAQLLTFPVCIYYFHQFPNLFLLTNMIAVPLSSFILYAEIVLLLCAGIPVAGVYAGKLVSLSVSLMNRIILWVNDLSFAVWDHIPATVWSTWLLYAVVACLGAWLVARQKKYFTLALVALTVFALQSIYSSWQTANQQKLVVYNVPRCQAVDFIRGDTYRFVGDSSLLEEGLLQNFHLKPARIAQQLHIKKDSLAGLFNYHGFYQFNHTRILLADTNLKFEAPAQKIDLDMVIISNNPKIRIAELLQAFNCKLIILDASNPAWKTAKWKAECEALELDCYIVAEKGAFIRNVGI